jgi:hypothetical protein
MLEAISKTRLRPDGGVAARLKMLTYSPCMLRFFAALRLAEHLYINNRYEVPEQGKWLDGDSYLPPHFDLLLFVVSVILSAGGLDRRNSASSVTI